MVNIEYVFVTISTTAPTHSQSRAMLRIYGEFTGAVLRRLFKKFHLVRACFGKVWGWYTNRKALH
jgi:hypothetical protein